MDERSAKSSVDWIKWVMMAFAIGGSWHVQSERIEVLQKHHGDHEKRLRLLEQTRIEEIKKMISDLSEAQKVANTKLDFALERLEEIGKKKRR